MNHRPFSRASLIWLLTLLVAVYLPVLIPLVQQWESDEDMGHGFFVPVIVAYIVWNKRKELELLTPKTSYWGLLLVVAAAAQLLVATLGAELFLARTAFVLSIFGSVWFLGGAAYLRTLIFPLLLLFFMVPIPALIYNQITFPLQLLASRAAEMTLMLCDIPVLREGNVLELSSGQRLQVVEACSGIRSLLSLSFLSLVYGFFFEENVRVRALLFVANVPIAIVANASRVTFTGILTEIDPEYARGFFHTASGWVIFMVALVILVVFHQLLLSFRKYVYDPNYTPAT
ncbi:MAG: exosortase/archaeosortase family protein [Bryobacteraceae bacterium]